MPTPREMLDRLDARHEELIRKLDALNADIERVLAEFARSRTPAAAVAPPTATEAVADEASPARRAA